MLDKSWDDTVRPRFVVAIKGYAVDSHLCKVR